MMGKSGRGRWTSWLEEEGWGILGAIALHIGDNVELVDLAVSPGLFAVEQRRDFEEGLVDAEQCYQRKVPADADSDHGARDRVRDEKAPDAREPGEDARKQAGQEPDVRLTVVLGSKGGKMGAPRQRTRGCQHGEIGQHRKQRHRRARIEQSHTLRMVSTARPESSRPGQPSPSSITAAPTHPITPRHLLSDHEYDQSAARRQPRLVRDNPLPPPARAAPLPCPPGPSVSCYFHGHNSVTGVAQG